MVWYRSRSAVLIMNVWRDGEGWGGGVLWQGHTSWHFIPPCHKAVTLNLQSPSLLKNDTCLSPAGSLCKVSNSSPVPGSLFAESTSPVIFSFNEWLNNMCPSWRTRKEIIRYLFMDFEEWFSLMSLTGSIHFWLSAKT